MVTATLENVGLVGSIDRLVRELQDVSGSLDSLVNQKNQLEQKKNEILSRIADVARNPNSQNHANYSGNSAKSGSSKRLGRQPKSSNDDTSTDSVGQKRRGRPPKSKTESFNGFSKTGKRLGRPPKNLQSVHNSDSNNLRSSSLQETSKTSNRQFANGNTMSLKDAIMKILQMSKMEVKKIVTNLDDKEIGLRVDDIRSIIDSTQIWKTKTGNVNSMFQVELYKLLKSEQISRTENSRYFVPA